MITDKTYKALKLLEKRTYTRGMTAKEFAYGMWGKNPKYSYLFGSCKSWLCGGSYLARLYKKGLVKLDCKAKGYFLSKNGVKEIIKYENR